MQRPTQEKHQLTTVDGQAVKTRTETAVRQLITATARKREGKLKGQFKDYTRDPAYKHGEALEQEAVATGALSRTRGSYG